MTSTPRTTPSSPRTATTGSSITLANPKIEADSMIQVALKGIDDEQQSASEDNHNQRRRKQHQTTAAATTSLSSAVAADLAMSTSIVASTTVTTVSTMSRTTSATASSAVVTTLREEEECEKGKVKEFPFSKQVGFVFERENKFFLEKKEGNPKLLGR